MKLTTIGKRIGIISLVLFIASNTVYGISSSETQNPLLRQQVEVKNENNSFLRNIASILRNRRLRTSSRFNQTTRPTLDTIVKKIEKEEDKIAVKKPTSSLYSRLRNFRNRRSLAPKTSSVKRVHSSIDYLNHLKLRNTRLRRPIK